MKNLRFSWIWSMYDARGYAMDGHVITPLDVVEISEMKEFNAKEWEQGFKNRIQMSTYDRRVIKDTPYDYWNGCIFIDIDYKNWVKNNPRTIIPPDVILKNTYDYMCAYYTNNLYYCELSRSGYGFHYIFYYDCEHTKDNFVYYNRYTQKMVETAFEECGYYDIIHYKGVFDDCSKSFCQCCYLTRNLEMFNDDCTGKLTMYKGISIEEDKIVPMKRKKFCSDKWIWEIESRNDNVKVEYINHITRWRLFDSLSRVCKNDEQLRQEWERCAKMIPEYNGHTTNYYINVPYSGDWYRNLKGDEFMDTKLLNEFGYKIRWQIKQSVCYDSLMKILNKMGN